MVLRLTLPADQDRLNAAVYECARLRVTGEIRIPGAWDAACATDYYETRTGAIVGQLSDSDFIFNGKHVFFWDRSRGHKFRDRVQCRENLNCRPRTSRSSPFMSYTVLSEVMQPMVCL